MVSSDVLEEDLRELVPSFLFQEYSSYSNIL